MDDNVLTDIPWITTTEGKKTIEETLLLSHVEGFNISKDQEGFFYGAQMRILAQVTALAIRNADRHTDDILDDGFSQETLNKTFEQLDEGAHLRSGKYPYMQWPLDTVSQEKGKKPVTKLLPTVTSDAAYGFWDLHAMPNELDPSEATLWVTVWGMYSMTGNTKISGKKPENFTPAFRLSPKHVPTEVIYEGDSLLETLIRHIDPAMLEEPKGLPAWADRTGEKSNSKTRMSRLWKATWTSNACILHWNDDSDSSVVQHVEIGGTPENWCPLPIKGNEKEWSDSRDQEDFFYCYKTHEYKGNTTRKLSYFPLDQNATALAVTWATANIYQPNRISISTGKNITPVLIQHRVEGTATSPSIRASRVTTTDPKTWVVAGNTDPDVVRNVKMLAEYVNDMRGCLEKAMQKRKDPESQKGYVFDEEFTPIRQDVLETFWNNLEQTYRKAALSFEEGEEFDQNIQRDIKNLTVATFKDITQPLQFTNPRKVFQSTKRLQTLLNNLDKKENSNE